MTEASGRREAAGGADALEIPRTLRLQEALRQVPAVLRESLELYAFKTGRAGVDAGELADLHRLGAIDPRNRSFVPQYPLWSDGAVKSRWIHLPESARIDPGVRHLTTSRGWQNLV